MGVENYARTALSAAEQLERLPKIPVIVYSTSSDDGTSPRKILPPAFDPPPDKMQ